jgi:hypothetical protein
MQVIAMAMRAQDKRLSILRGKGSLWWHVIAVNLIAWLEIDPA